MNPKIDSYLDDLDHQLRDIPRSQRQELIDDVRAHIEDALAEFAHPSDTEVLNVLDRMGTPSALAAEERAKLGIVPRQVASVGCLRTGLDIAAIILTLVLWPIGMIFLWSSPSWSTRSKLIGTLVPPGGYFVILCFLLLSNIFVYGGGCTDSRGQSSCGTQTPGWEVALLVTFLMIWLVSPLVTAIYLSAKLAGSRRNMPGVPAALAI